jgi:hypothetical protein
MESENGDKEEIPCTLYKLLSKEFIICHAYKPGKTIIWEDTLKEYRIDYYGVINSTIGVIGVLEDKIRFLYNTIADSNMRSGGSKDFQLHELDELAKFVEQVKDEQLLAYYTHYPID